MKLNIKHTHHAYKDFRDIQYPLNWAIHTKCIDNEYISKLERISF